MICIWSFLGGIAFTILGSAAVLALLFKYSIADDPSEQLDRRNWRP